MSNLSDKEIDRLSREAADSYEPDHATLSWSRLEQMLTEQMPERPPDGFRFSRINPYVWGPAVVLLAGISFYVIKSKFYSKISTPTAQIENINGASSKSSDQVATADNKKTVETNISKINAETGVGSASDKSKVADASLSNAAAEASGNITSSAKKGTSLSRTGASGNQMAAVSTDANRSSGKSKNSVAADQQNRRIAGNANTNGAGMNQNAIGQSSVTGAAGPAIGISAATALNRAMASPSLPALATGSSGLVKVYGSDSLLSKSGSTGFSLKSKSLRINRSLNIGLAFGPDYTDAGGISNNQFGNNIGLTVGYYLTNKISVNTGIFYSNKFFWTPGSPTYSPQLTANRNFFTAPAAEYINGSFNLYEIPLTLRYDFAASKKSKFFVNAGLSSYFIISQNYIHFFHNAGNTLAWKISENSQENHWFGVGDISLGVETDIGRGFSFQAEPFLKIPFKPMGIEGSKLTSYGFLLSFRYSPVLRKSKK